MISKTLNPIHFEDLDPHRFEDLIRQLIYNFKEWKSLEALGRLGSDNGIDILGIEIIRKQDSSISEKDDNGYTEFENYFENDWIIQCKREKSISPQKVINIIKDNLDNKEAVPFGYIIAAACDFSKKTRDLFRLEMNKKNIQEFYLWGKAEIEDMLFRPENDHLLFAYFGISLQQKKKSQNIQLIHNLSIKRKIVKIYGSLDEHISEPVLIKNIEDDSYPYISNPEEFIKNPQWFYFPVDSFTPPDHISFIIKTYFAYVDWENGKWDIINSYNDAVIDYPMIFGLPDNNDNKWDIRNKLSKEWLDLPDENKGYFHFIKKINFKRIMAIDEIGDLYNPPPHLLVEFINNQPFDTDRVFETIESTGVVHKRLNFPKMENRIKIFNNNS